LATAKYSIFPSDDNVGGNIGLFALPPRLNRLSRRSGTAFEPLLTQKVLENQKKLATFVKSKGIDRVLIPLGLGFFIFYFLEKF